jgi:hypothetical protein
LLDRREPVVAAQLPAQGPQSTTRSRRRGGLAERECGRSGGARRVEVSLGRVSLRLVEEPQAAIPYEEHGWGLGLDLERLNGISHPAERHHAAAAMPGKGRLIEHCQPRRHRLIDGAEGKFAFGGVQHPFAGNRVREPGVRTGGHRVHERCEPVVAAAASPLERFSAQLHPRGGIPAVADREAVAGAEDVGHEGRVTGVRGQRAGGGEGRHGFAKVALVEP